MSPQNVLEGEAVFQNIVTEIFAPLYQLIAALAVVYFLYGVMRFIIDMNDPEKKNFGKSHLLWGLVGVFIVFTAGAVLPIFTNIFGGMFSF